MWGMKQIIYWETIIRLKAFEFNSLKKVLGFVFMIGFVVFFCLFFNMRTAGKIVSTVAK